MKEFIFILTLIVSVQIAIGQIDTTIIEESPSPLDELPIILPEFNGGQDAIVKIISDNMTYPINSQKKRIGGKVITQFLIDTLGNVTNIKVLKGINEEIDSEAIRLIGLLKGWTPGTQNGKKVSTSFYLPLYFYPDEKFRQEYKIKNGIKN